MGDRRDYDGGRRRSSSADRGSHHGFDRRDDRRDDQYHRRSPPRCFSCNEIGHYANHSPNRWHAPEAKPSTLYDVNRGRSASPRKGFGATSMATKQESKELRHKIKELNKSLASVSEFVLAEKARKAEEERLRLEAEAEAGRLESKAKVRTKLSPYVEKLKKTPGQPSTVEKLRFRNQQMKDLRALGALELQGICKDEGVAYNDTVDAIFDIASYRTRVHFGDIEPIDLSIVAD
ncbi:hypothetical protein CBR_g10881 [Chara braunii]|uniref:CCHC-type domain-containing protein n=1 Tax=Chara braunii TaxID=69332 RepID=A0A388KPG4_CHABU|nr:hypothetical protein CBR_g10881 [Chara braunii]|eukprot:GBG71944.1 hypothetical protein CBR_g10881 [Chara braunii]